jgi:hypothetical protein
MVPVPVPVPTFEKLRFRFRLHIDGIKSKIFKLNFGNFFGFLLCKLFYKEKVYKLKKNLLQNVNENNFNKENQIHNFQSSSGSGTVINYGSDSDFLTSYGSGSTSQKVTVPTVRVPVPQRCLERPPAIQEVGGSNPSSDSMAQMHYLKDGDYLGEGFPQ